MSWKSNYNWGTVKDRSCHSTTCKYESWKSTLRDKEKCPNANQASLKLYSTQTGTLCTRMIARLFRIMPQRITDQPLASRTMALMLSSFILFVVIPVFADENTPQVESITGENAKRMILDGIVVESFSKEVQYGVKYYYSVLYFGYTWLCEQATYRTTCNLQK